MTTTAGLFQLNMIDHHAILGFSLAAEPKQVRKRYLKVARKLHPDSLREASDEERQLASDLLSKRVNPAYEALSQDKSAKEHKVLLKMKQKQLSADRSLVTLTSEAAKALLTADQDLDASYAQALEVLCADQFSDLTKVETITGEISELNAVYLMRKQGTVSASPQSATQAAAQPAAQSAVPAASANPSAHSAPSAKSSTPPSGVPKRSHRDVIIQSYLKRAQEFESQQDYSRGILELREAIASHPKSATCHGYLSSLYLKSGQATLAKIHAKQALGFDPENEMAKTVQAKLSARSGGSAKRAANGKKTAAKGKKNSSGSKKGGGLLSGLFGGKKR